MAKIPIPIILAAIIVVAAVGLGAKGLLFSAPQGQNGGANVFEPDPVLSNAQETGGVQVVNLSMGSGNYTPEVIRVKKGIPVRIVADLSKVQGCFRSFLIPQLGVRTYFSDKSDSVEFTPTEAGTFAFSCSMGMGRGTLVVT